jgi:hypothetical protein
LKTKSNISPGRLDLQPRMKGELLFRLCLPQTLSTKDSVAFV